MPQPELHRLLAWLKSTQVPGTRDECRMAHHMPIPLLGDRVRMSGPKIKRYLFMVGGSTDRSELENNGKAGGGACAAGPSPCLDSSLRFLEAAT